MGYPLWSYAVLAVVAFYCSRRLSQGSTKLPPSPPRDPIVGHALRIPFSQTWKAFAEWGRLYGPVVYAQVLGRSLIIINSVNAARDLMEKKGGNFSDRPRMPLLEIIGWDAILPSLPYGTAQFRKQRRLMQQYLGSSSIRSLDCIQEGRIQKFLQRLLTEPDGFYDHIHGHVASVIVQAVYGHEISGDPMDDSLIKMTEEVTKMITATGSLGATVIDFFPFLRHFPTWIPGMGLKRKALEIRKILQVVFSSPFEEARIKKATGNASPSILYQLLNEYEDTREISPQDEEDMKTFAGTFYSAGTDTTKTALHMFFLMMVFNPEVQRRAQEDINRIIGLDRLPLLSDRPNLPYIDCIMKEVLRISPPIPLGVPHQSIQTDGYRGWTIPAQSMIIPNIWRMMRDEDTFPDPEKFDPDRHEIHGKRKRTVDIVSDDPAAPVFGFGRRSCPGRAFAESTMWITMANVLAAFDILPYRDPITRKEAFPAVEFESEILNAVKPFKCSIIPRKGRVEQIVRDGIF